MEGHRGAVRTPAQGAGPLAPEWDSGAEVGKGPATVTGAELSLGHSSSFLCSPNSILLPLPWECPPKFTVRGMSLPRPPLLYPHLRATDLCPAEEETPSPGWAPFHLGVGTTAIQSSAQLSGQWLTGINQPDGVTVCPTGQQLQAQLRRRGHPQGGQQWTRAHEDLSPVASLL